MANPAQVYFGPEQSPAEITVKVIVLAILLTIVLAVANTYLALKIGMLTSASIPAAVLSMAVLRLFHDRSILENNLVQTAASAGEAVAGGIVYTVPALIIIHYWHGFDYWDNVCIALLGGLLGVLFSIPMRAALMRDTTLHFPEGRAIAEVLKAQALNRHAIRHLLVGGAFGGVIELLQNGFKVLAEQWSYWFEYRHAIFGFGIGYSPAMLGAGYIIGFRMCLSIFLGGMVGLVAVPITSLLQPELIQTTATASFAQISGQLRYFAVGAMMFAGLWTSLYLLRTFYSSAKNSLAGFGQQRQTPVRTEYDLPLVWVLSGIIILAAALYAFFNYLLPIPQLHIGSWSYGLLIAALGYCLIFGFIFSAITAYFSGLVGVSASPGSAIIIAGLLISSLSLLAFLHWHHGTALTADVVLAAQATVIILGAIVTGSAAIANDNMQDLKVGHILGATPWKQQAMLILGVVVAAFVIPPVMQLLFTVYGIADVLPHAGMMSSNALPAPQATLMATLTQALLQHNLPWQTLYFGFVAIFLLIIINRYLKRFDKDISPLGFAMGLYLPLTTSTPLFMGGCFAWLVTRTIAQQDCRQSLAEHRQHSAMLLASGLVAGAALMDVMLAIPFSWSRDLDSLRLLSNEWHNMTALASITVTALLAARFYYVVRAK